MIFTHDGPVIPRVAQRPHLIVGNSAETLALKGEIERVARSDAKVVDEFQKFASRRLRSPAAEDDTLSGSKLLVAALTSESPRETVLEAYVQELSGPSLQSASELLKVTAALGIQGMLSTYGRLGDAFRARNQIIHELDINFQHPTRNRQTRALAEMVQLSDEILRVAAHILQLTDEKLAKYGGA